MNGRDVVRLGLLSAPRRPMVTKHAHRTFGVPLRVNCSCATRKQLLDLFSPLRMRRRVPIWNWLLTVVLGELPGSPRKAASLMQTLDFMANRLILGWRRGSESNRRMRVLQTLALP